jgi:putative transposase
MPDIRVLVACVSPCIAPTPLRRLGRVIAAMLSMSGRVTMRGLSRWSGKGGSDRTIQRFFTTRLNWWHLHWLLMRQHVLDADEGVVRRGDYGVVTPSGKTPSGLERFFSSLYGKAMPGLCFLRVSLRRVKRRTSSPVVTEHVEQACAAAAHAPPTTTSRGARGRPKGSKNRHRREGERSPSRHLIQEPIKRVLQQSGDACKVVSFIFDGELGQNDARQRGRQVGLHVVSKLR